MKTRQQRYGRTLRSPFGKIAAEARRAVRERDVFGLRDGASNDRLAWNPDELTSSEFRSGDVTQNHRVFMSWLRRQQERGVLTTISRSENEYVRRSVADGVKFADARLRERGVPVEGAEIGVGPTFQLPVDRRRLQLLFERNYSLLEGITEDTAKELSRVVSEGLTEGQNPTAIADSITDRVNAVSKTRATAMARHEVMYSHNWGAVERYSQHGVDRVEVLLGPDPCPDCQSIAANDPYRLRDARGLLPQHPNCTCSLAPLVD